MRKGFILTLTALVTALMVTSAVAMGPTVSGMPDVYIGPNGDNANTFRYSTALTLWQYVTVGVTTGDGSTSDTLYTAWAAKDADFSGGTGSYLTSGVNYSIIQENGVEGLLLSPTTEVGATGWAAEINNGLNAEGAGLTDYTVANAGQLTFRNVRLSPLPEEASYPAPVASAGMPAGVLDLQEATIYVSDTNTTPGADKILLVTMQTGDDYLSGGLKFSSFADYSADTTGFTSFKLANRDSGTTPDTNPSAVTLSKTGTSLSFQTPMTNTPTGYYYYGTYGWVQTTMDETNLYRLQASVSGSNGPSGNPSILLGFNSRGDGGYAFTQITPSQGPGTTPEAWSAYLAPTKSCTPDLVLGVLDPGDTWGGTVVMSNIKIDEILLNDVLGSADSIATINSFTVGSTENTTEWYYLDAAADTASTKPTFSHTPTAGGSGSSLLLQASTSSATNIGYASLNGPGNTFATTSGKLVIIRAKLATSSADSAKLPTAWLNVETAAFQPGMLIERTAGVAGSGPTTSATDFYLAFEAREATAKFNFRIIADKAGIAGNVILSEVEAMEVDVPAEP